MSTDNLILNDGTVFPLVNSYVNPQILGKTFVWDLSKNTSEEQKKLWISKGYQSIKLMTQDKFNTSGVYDEKKTLWFVLMNRPRFLVITTDFMTEYIMSVIKFCVTSGIHVGIQDNGSGYKDVIEAVYNRFSNRLFSYTKAEQVMKDPKETEERKKLAAMKVKKLQKARAEAMEHVWPEVNVVLKPLNEAVRVAKISAIEYFSAKEEREELWREAKDFNLSLEDVNSMLEDMKQFISIWADAYDIDSPVLEESERHAQTWMPTKWKRGYSSNGYIPIEACESTQLRQRLNAPKVSVLEIFRTYEQIQFYLKENIQICNPAYFLCRDCGLPVRRNVDNVIAEDPECRYCGTGYYWSWDSAEWEPEA